MITRSTEFPGLIIIEPRVFGDERGYFFESYHATRYLQNEIPAQFIQDNESMSGRGVIRGLHYQLNPFAQAKLVRVVEGEVFDVAVDLRKGSPGFGKWFGIVLSGNNKTQLFIPEGFAHGFAVLSEYAIFSYKCTSYYNSMAERGMRFNDPSLNIDWKLPQNEIIISEKDRNAPFLGEAEMNFIFR